MNTTVIDLFESQTACIPDNDAVVCASDRLSYSELNAKANRLARYLQTLGAGPEVAVGICLPRSPDMIVSVIALLKAGAAYVPLDIGLPARRLAALISDAGCRLVLTSRRLAESLSSCSIQAIVVDECEVLARYPAGNLNRELVPASAAYIMYTSGTSGAPKGVVVEHRQLLNYVRAIEQRASLESVVTFAMLQPLAVDSSVTVLYSSLCGGGRLLLVPEEMAIDAHALKEYFAAHPVDCLKIAPSHLMELQKCLNDGSLVRMSRLIVGGEASRRTWLETLQVMNSRCVIFNHYGPTETTVGVLMYRFETCLGDNRSDNVPIGRPVANVRAYVLDGKLEPVPAGVGGELYVGGLAPARGYLHRAGMTAERFVADPYGEPGARMYRTGDMAQWRSDGNVEFLGRTDQQVKIRGFRIEVEEIEAMLREHSRVQDAVVRVQGVDDKRLVAYVVRDQSEAEKAEARVSYLREWREVYESPSQFDVGAWQSSYTGLPIPDGEMEIWVEETVKRLQGFGARRVVEIGCGTGLILTRLGTGCERYIGLDFSGTVLKQLEAYLKSRPDLQGVELRQGLAHELAFLDTDSVDLVVLNSVVQYFPDVDYLLDVLTEAVRITHHGGHIFVGDVRSLPLLEAYHTSVQLYKAAAETPVSELRWRIRQAQHNDKELVLNPRLFEELGRRWQKPGRIESWLKTGAYDNELSRFRYDIVMHMGEKESLASPDRWINWDEAGQWRQDLEKEIKTHAGITVGVRGIRDQRVTSAVEAVRLLHGDIDGGNCAGELQRACTNKTGEDPDAVIKLARVLGVGFSWQGLNGEGVCDGIFRPKWVTGGFAAGEPRSFYRRYGNAPARSVGDVELGRELQQYARGTLPDYMVPAAIVVLEALPLTAHGKLDRKALPTVDFGTRSATWQEPRTPEEEILCGVFAEVLGVEQIGIDDNFFELGGHSLMATRLVSRIRTTLGIEIAIRTLFEWPTVRQLGPNLRQARKGKVPLVRQDRPERLPPSCAQQRLWFIDQLEPSSTEYNIAQALRLHGRLELEALERAVCTIVERHESLRTHFVEEEGEPWQVVDENWQIKVPVEDLSGYGEAEQGERVRVALREQGVQPFDLSRGPMLRVRLLKLDELDYVLLRTFHHIVSDAWSQAVFNRELMVLYEAYCAGHDNPLRPLAVQYADFALWQRAWLDGGALDEGLKYWKEQLAGIPERLELPADRPRPSSQTYEGESCQTFLPAGQVNGLKRLGRENQATLYMTLLSAFAVLLSRYCGQDDIVVGSPIANRQEAHLEEMIGFFVNTLVMRVRTRPEMSFRELLEQVRGTTLEAYQYQDVPFERLVEELSPQRSLNTTPVFQVVFAVQNAPSIPLAIKDIRTEPFASDKLRVHADVEVHVFEQEGQIGIFWAYNRDLFDTWRMEQMLRHYTRIIDSVLKNPDEAIGRVDMLGAEERQRILQEWNETKHEVPDTTVSMLFEQQAERTPDAVAVVYGQEQITYGVLNTCANQLAWYLIERGIGPEDIVALALPRSVEMVVSLLGVMKAGAAYLPLDPEYPDARLGSILHDAHPKLVLAFAGIGQRLKNDIPQLALDNLEQLTNLPTRNPLPQDLTASLDPLSPVYVIYTSGSTGFPKAVIITQISLSNALEVLISCVACHSDSYVFQGAALGFDVATSEILVALLAGARLILAQERERSGADLGAALVRENITHAMFPPSVLATIPVVPAPCECLLIGGETCAADVASRWSADRCMLNVYGQTETGLFATASGRCESQATLTAGAPINGVRVYVLDQYLQPVPFGVTGEVYVAGIGLGRGYWNNSTLTAERFIADPHSKSGERMYRSADLGRWQCSRMLQFIGRTDDQIKLRGFRVETEEVAAVLRSHQSVANAVVIARDTPRGEKQLIGYVVPKVDHTIYPHELRAEVAAMLPDYMVPAAIVVLEALPLTAHGKLDRKALPTVDFGTRSATWQEPRTPEEEILCGVFAEVLGVEQIGIDDNFFELGGHSLMATRLVSRIRTTLGIEIAIRTLFEWPTVRQLGPNLRQARKGKVPLVRQDRPERLPPSCAQQRLWFIDQLEPSSTEYNIAQALRLHGRLELEALERAVCTIVERHESLRTHFVEEEGEPWQVVDENWQIKVPVEDLSGYGEAEQGERVRVALREQGVQPFDLSRGPMLRVRLLKLDELDYVLLRTFHHVAADGWSEGIFNRELMVLYEAYCAGRDNPLRPLAVQYADFALWQRAWLDGGALDEGLKYWKEQLAGIPERLELPADRPRPSSQTYEGESCQTFLPAGQVNGLKRLGRENQATLYMTLLSAFAVLLSRYCGQDDIVVGSPIANRQEAHLEEMIGFFVNTLVMRVRTRPEMSFRELLEQVRGTTLEAYQYQDVPFERLVEELSPQRSLNTTPVFQVVFAVQNAPSIPLAIKDIRTEPFASDKLRVRYDVEVHVFEQEGQIGIFWAYNRDLFDTWRMEQMLRHYTRIIDSVLKNPDEAIGRVDMLGAEERQRILQEWNETKHEVPDTTVSMLFEQQAERTPDAVAVVYGQEQITYGVLNTCANQLAWYLIERGIGPEDIVALALPRSVEMVVSLLGVMKAGAAYLPLDPEYPDARLKYAIDDSGAKIVLAGRQFARPCPASTATTYIVDDILSQPGERTAGRGYEGRQSELAYIVYTSGSTGKPKPVAVEHGSLTNSTIARWIAYKQLVDRFLLVSNLAFDSSVAGVFWTLSQGGQLHLPEKGDEREPLALGRYMERAFISHVLCLPTLYQIILDQTENGSPSGLCAVIVAGETCPRSLVDRHFSTQEAALANEYGPTEATVWSTMYCCSPATDSERIPIGRPVANVRAYVLDGKLEPVPAGVGGELYVGGLAPARGYLHRAGMTAERFVADPYGEPGARMYRTGDMAQWRSDGNVEFLGRTDQQVKIRGFRIEVEEIEAMLREHSRVQDAVVRVQGVDDKRLVAYVVRDQSEAEKAEARVSYLREWREVYESPSQFDVGAWQSSYTGLPIPDGEMEIWVEETVKRLQGFGARRVVEIGCGTGLILTRLGTGCERYIGLDFSGTVLKQLEAYLKSRPDLQGVELRQGLAHELAFLDTDSVDLVVLNSVVQYFPDVDYLLDVLTEAVRITHHGGHIFVGDVRSLPLLEAYHTSVQLYKAAAETPVSELRWRIRQAQHNDKELVLNPRLFEELGRRWQKPGRIESWLKTGAYDNELSRFRYDIVMHMGEKESLASPDRWINWDEAGQWRQDLEKEIKTHAGITVGVRGIRDQRVTSAVEAVRLLHGDIDGGNCAGELQRACTNKTGEDPDAVIKLARVLGVGFSWQGLNGEGVCDGIFRPKWVTGGFAAGEPRSFYRRYGNAPARSVGDVELGRELQQYARGTLPDYMVPAAIVVLEALPLTAHGKLDRKALPTVDFGTRSATWQEPRTPEEEILCGVFAEVLGVEQIGIDDNFFELGGHSLMATRLVSRIRTTLGIEIAIRTLFEWPTVRQLGPNLRQARKGKVPLVRQDRPERLPPSCAQQRLWFIDQLEPSSTEYNIAQALRLHGRLELEALERAVCTIVERHESLRTHFVEEEGEPWQVVDENWQIKVPVEDLSGYGEAEQGERVRVALREQGVQPFDLSRGPMLRVRLLKLDELDYVLLRTFHHIVSDAWSQAVFNRELMVLYEAYCAGHDNPLRPLAVQYADFALWQRAWLDGGALDEGLKYWKEQLAGIPERLELPADRPRPSSQTYEGESCQTFLPAGQVNGLKRLGRENQATLYMTLLSAFAVLLSRYCGQDDIVVGSPIANRQEAHLEEMIGFFVNTLVMRVRTRPEMSFRELLEQVRGTTLEAYQYQDVPFERLVEELSPQRSLNTTPVFQVVFAVQNAPSIPLAIKDIRTEPFASDKLRVHADVEVHVFEQEGQIGIFWAYNRDLFDTWRMEQMLRHYTRIIDSVLKNPDEAIGRVDMLGAEERQRILQEWNETKHEVPDTTVSMLFEQQAERTPDAVAVVYGQEQITYGVLNTCANQLAWYLIERGIGPEDIVALALPRSVEMVVSLLGVMKAGAAYLPLDPEYPDARLGSILHDAHPKLVLAFAGIGQRLKNDIPQLALDNLEQLTNLPTRNPLPQDLTASLDPLSPVYVIYTSGSTGFPKAVIITHEGVVNRILWMQSLIVLQSSDRVLQKTPYSFDVSVWEFFWPLLYGAGLVVLYPNAHRDPARIVETIELAEITVLHFVPSMLRVFLEYTSAAPCTSLRHIICSGEALPAKVRDDCFEHLPSVSLHNLYGPTEAAIDVTFWTCSREESSTPPPIGKPIWNIGAYVLDQNLQPAPVGVAGELYLAGVGVGRGYLDRPALTAQRFVGDPCGKPGNVMYRTGDLVRWRLDGAIEFLGRSDEQVKIRGCRVEVGEIEAALSRTNEIKRSIVIAHEYAPGDTRLIAYVVPVEERRIDTDLLVQLLGKDLPAHMVPSVIVPLKTLPLNAHGKLDRRALPAPDCTLLKTADGYHPPSTVIEDQLCNIWAGVLHVGRVGVHDNFFALGGHSLAAINVIAKIREAFGQWLPLSIIFQKGTVHSLAQHLQAKQRIVVPAHLIPVQPLGCNRPFFCVHSASGVAYPYIPLARILGEGQPFYALEAVGIGGSSPHMRIEDMSKHYIEQMRTIQPCGPYLLGGWSFGGIVAYEMARQLSAVGERVGLVAILDSILCQPSLSALRHQEAMSDTDVLASMFPDGIPDLSPDNVSVLVRVWRANHTALYHYVPRPYEGRISLFITEETRVLRSSLLPRWNEFVPGGVDEYIVPGNHLNMMRSPQVEFVASQLGAALAKANDFACETVNQ